VPILGLATRCLGAISEMNMWIGEKGSRGDTYRGEGGKEIVYTRGG